MSCSGFNIFLNSEFYFFISSAILVTSIGIMISLITSILFAIKPVRSKPAKILRTVD